jgi:hypothetical protein
MNFLPRESPAAKSRRNSRNRALVLRRTGQITDASNQLYKDVGIQSQQLVYSESSPHLGTIDDSNCLATPTFFDAGPTLDIGFSGADARRLQRKGLSAAESNQVHVFLFRLKTIIRAMLEPYTPHDVNTHYLIRSRLYRRDVRTWKRLQRRLKTANGISHISCSVSVRD